MPIIILIFIVSFGAFCYDSGYQRFQKNLIADCQKKNNVFACEIKAEPVTNPQQ